MKNVISSRKVGRQQIGSLSQEDRDLLTLRTKCTFHALSDICIYHEKKYIDRYQATQRYCVNPFKTHGIQISKDLRNADEELALSTLFMAKNFANDVKKLLKKI